MPLDNAFHAEPQWSGMPVNARFGGPGGSFNALLGARWPLRAAWLAQKREPY